MKIEKNTVVTLSYHLETSAQGEQKQFVEETPGDHPFTFLFGSGGLISGFENNVRGLSAGEA